MEVIKLALDWAKDEIFSSKFFIYFGLLFMASALGFWKMGKTEMAKAYTYPMLVCGFLLLLIGGGLVYANMTRIKQFQKVQQVQITEFIHSEIARADQTVASYENAVFKVIPIIILGATLLIFWVDKPIWRAAAITTVAMMVVILIVDTNASARMKVYKEKLTLISKLESE